MDDDNDQYAYFTVAGDFDPAEITARAGIAPSGAWRKGDLNARGMERRHSRWILQSRLPRSESLENHVRDVLVQLDPHAQAIAQISQEYGGWMELVGYFHAGYPGLFLERDIVAGLARYSLSVDFDFYGLYSNRRNDTEE